MYGSPGFLAAYNGGPRRLDDYLSNERPLPDETRRYVAMIAPAIAGVYPAHRSPAETYAMNQLPIEIPGGLRYGRVQMASSREPERRTAHHAGDTRGAPALAAASGGAAGGAIGESSPPPGGSEHRHRGFRLIQTASAEPAPVAHGGKLSGGWGSRSARSGARAKPRPPSAGEGRGAGALGVAHPMVASVHQAHATLWRARLTGLSREAAVKACGALSRGRKNCIVLSPEAQS